MRVLTGLLLGVSLSAAAAQVQLDRSGEQVTVRINGKPFTTYYFDPKIAKPYLMPLRTASGVVVTRSFPVGNSAEMGNPKANSFEPHQRPLYFGHGDIDGLDFWQEQVFDHYYSDHGHQAYGHVALKKLDDVSGNRVRATFTLRSPSDRVIGEETQTYAFSGDEHSRVVDCEIVLTATNGPLDLGDTKEGTFALRLAPELSAPHVRMINSQGAEGEKAIWGKPAEWVDYSGQFSGKQVDVAVFDSPRSFRHPTTWHARAYGLFAANPFGWREFTRDENKDGSWALAEGKSMRFRYRVLIHEGPFGADEIGKAYSEYAAGEK